MKTGCKFEKILWHLTTQQMPDDETTVLIQPAGDEVSIGYHVDGSWFELYRSEPTAHVVAWADLPAGVPS